MRRSRPTTRRPRGTRLVVRRLGALLLGALLLGTILVVSRSTAPAVGASPGGEPTAQTDASVPLRRVTMIGSEGSGEAWGVGVMGEGIGQFPTGIVHYTPGGGWSLAPTPQDHTGAPLAHLKLYQQTTLSNPSPIDAQMTSNGSGVLAGSIPLAGGGASEEQQVLLVRDPGQPFTETAPIPSEGEKALLKHGETLFAERRAPLIAPLEEPSGGGAGALVVPVGAAGSAQQQVLHWDGKEWSSEPIEVPGTSEQEKEESGFQVLAIGASSPTNAWLLAEPSSESEGVALYRRSDGHWKRVSPAPLEVQGEQLTVPGEPRQVQAQVLTVTEQGVWVDGRRPGAKESATLFLKPEGALGGSVSASWCALPSGRSACTYTLPEELPSGPMRSFAWPSSESPYGERVITGFNEGVTLRLDGTSFTRVLALGGSVSGAPGRLLRGGLLECQGGLAWRGKPAGSPDASATGHSPGTLARLLPPHPACSCPPARRSRRSALQRSDRRG